MITSPRVCSTTRGIDLILVGDSVSNVFQGNNTTLPVTLDEMIYHTKAVSRIVRRAMVVTDLPFMSYQVTTEEAFRSAGRVMKETSAGGVKVEGGRRVAGVVEKMAGEGIPCDGAHRPHAAIHSHIWRISAQRHHRGRSKRTDRGCSGAGTGGRLCHRSRKNPRNAW
jgi:3-methyl-2-oxobutanoate hydroxymethyltransferase